MAEPPSLCGASQRNVTPPSPGAALRLRGAAGRPGAVVSEATLEGRPAPEELIAETR